MPNIDTELQKIMSAVYGEEVRGSIHDAIQKMNNNLDTSGQIQLRESIAPIWVGGHAYEKDDYVWYTDVQGSTSVNDSHLFRALRDIPISESTWVSSHWERVTESAEIYRNADDIIKVQNAQPTEKINKIWIKDRESEVSVPTFEEFEELEGSLYNIIGNKDDLFNSNAVKITDFDYLYWALGGPSAGKAYKNANCYSSKLIPIEGSTTYTLFIPRVRNDCVYIGFYNDNYEFLSYISVTSRFMSFTTPANAYYMRSRSNDRANFDVTYPFLDDLSQASFYLVKGTDMRGVSRGHDLYSSESVIIDEVFSTEVPIVINGYISSNNGKSIYDNPSFLTNCMTKDILHVKARNSFVIINNASKFSNSYVYYYDEHGTYLRHDTITARHYIFGGDEDYYVRFHFQGNQAISSKDVYDAVVFNLIQYGRARNEIEVGFLGLFGDNSGSTTPPTFGNSTIYRFPNGKVLVNDSWSDDWKNRWYETLRRTGIKKIDYIVLSHYHSDHVGGFLSMLNTSAQTYVDVRGAIAFVPPELTAENISHISEATSVLLYQRQLLSGLNSKGVTVVRPTEGYTLEIDDNCKIQFFNCDHSAYSDRESEYYSSNYNDYSLCMKVYCGDSCIVNTADLGPVGQKKMAPQMTKSDVLMSMHHGWDNGDDRLIPDFINAVAPKIVVSENGSNHLPSNTTSNACILLPTSPMQTWCESNNVPHYLTCLNGNMFGKLTKTGFFFTGNYKRYIRFDRNWHYDVFDTKFKIKKKILKPRFINDYYITDNFAGAIPQAISYILGEGLESTKCSLRISCVDSDNEYACIEFIVKDFEYNVSAGTTYLMDAQVLSLSALNIYGSFSIAGSIGNLTAVIEIVDIA